MFGVISYIGVCGLISGLLAFVIVITRPIHTHGEMRSWRIWIAFFLVTLFLPYGFFEVLTRKIGPEMKTQVEDALWDIGVRGELRYYRVLFYTGKVAHVVAVTQEKAGWGGTDRPVVRLTLVKEKDGWAVEAANVVYSDNRNLDGVVFPPFW
jgi:hypothetical protein